MKLHISVDEAVSICGVYGDPDSIDFSLDVARKFEERFKPCEKKDARLVAILFASLFEAGRMQGIREERAKEMSGCLK